MSFRGINTTVIQIRRQVFTEVARMAYANVKLFMAARKVASLA